MSTSLFFLLVQVIVLKFLRPIRLIGDETEYVNASKGEKSNSVWIRVPLMFWIGRCIRFVIPNSGDSIFRLSISVISALSAAMVVTAAYMISGIQTAVMVGLFQLVLVERIILACHIWPDTVLGLWLTAFCILLLITDNPIALGILGFLAAMAFLTRFEYLILSLLGWLVVIFKGVPIGDSTLFLLVPTLITLTLLSIYNKWKFATWWPDTTFIFNIAVSKLESDKPNLKIEQLMQHTLSHFRQTNSATLSEQYQLIPNKWGGVVGLFKGVIKRHISLLSQETFLERFFWKNSNPVYQGTIADSMRYFFLPTLRWGFTALCVVCLFVMPLMIAKGEVLWMLPVLCMYISASFFQTRTRYRVAFVPTMVLFAALGLQEINRFETEMYWGLLNVTLFIILISIVKPRQEI
jgi:hypothetical protein